MTGMRVVSSVAGLDVRGRGRRQRHGRRRDGSRCRLLLLPGRRVAPVPLLLTLRSVFIRSVLVRSVLVRSGLARAVAVRGVGARSLGRRQRHGREDPGGRRLRGWRLRGWRLRGWRRRERGRRHRGLLRRGFGADSRGRRSCRRRRRRSRRRSSRRRRSRADRSRCCPERDEQARPNCAGGRQMPGRRCGQADSLRLRHGAEVPREHGRAPNRPRQQDRCEETVDAPHASTPHCRQHHSKEVSAGRGGHLNMVGDEGEMGG